jgi:hypothetical protein
MSAVPQVRHSATTYTYRFGYVQVMSFEQSFLPTFEPGNYAEQASSNAGELYCMPVNIFHCLNSLLIDPDSWMWSSDLAR